LRKEKIRLLYENVGGTVARTVEFDSATGTGIIHSYGHPDINF
jgi:chemotaxis protein CheD